MCLVWLFVCICVALYVIYVVPISKQKEGAEKPRCGEVKSQPAVSRRGQLIKR